MRSYHLILGALAVTFLAVVYATAAEENLRFHDRQRFLVQTGTTDVDVSASDYEAAPVALLAIAPNDDQAMHDVKITFDLDKATTGFNDVATSTVTAILSVQRKVDGTNWRTDIAEVTTAIAASTTASRGLTLNLGTVTPTEGARIAIQIGSEASSGDMEFPYACTYRSGASATFTEVSN